MKETEVKLVPITLNALAAEDRDRVVAAGFEIHPCGPGEAKVSAAFEAMVATVPDTDQCHLEGALAYLQAIANGDLTAEEAAKYARFGCEELEAAGMLKDYPFPET